jgi:hypothetical protein
MNSETFTNLLDEFMIPSLPLCIKEEPIFQRDNAQIQESKATMVFFSDRDIDVMDWPADSSDLYPQEEAWNALSQKVYANGRTLSSITSLKLAIQARWNQITLPGLNVLLNSMPNRMFELISR